MKIVAAVISVALFGVFVLGATFNARCWIRGSKDEPHPSVAPLIAGVAGCLALLLFPFYHVVRYAWLPLVIDVGCLPYTIGASTYLWYDWWITRPGSKVKALQYKSSDVHLTVTLFRTGQVRMLKTNLAPGADSKGQAQWQTMSNGGEWTKNSHLLTLKTYQGTITYREVEPEEYVWQSSDKPTAFDRFDLKSE